ncbi:MAG: cytochrome c biogenesis protein CcsA [Bacteroidetes bacterium]|nr:cytochrome c biogenesis protein CcsA [Bacteroidota bacterium]
MGVTFIVDLLRLVLPLLYAVLVVVYGITFFTSAPRLERTKHPALILVILLHGAYLAARTIAFDHPPITSVFEILTLLAVSNAIAYLYVEFRTHVQNTGLFVLSFTLVFQTVSSIFIKDLLVIPDYLHSLVLGFHVSTALLGYTALSLSAVYGLLYLMLYHEIKSSRFGMVYSRLPNLEMLETMSHRAEVFGFVMLSIAILIGVVWLPVVFKDISYLDPKLIGTIAIWCLYALALMAKRKGGWQGRKTMIVSLVGFAFVFLSMIVINIYLSSFHTFH